MISLVCFLFRWKVYHSYFKIKTLLLLPAQSRELKETCPIHHRWAVMDILHLHHKRHACRNPGKNPGKNPQVMIFSKHPQIPLQLWKAWIPNSPLKMYQQLAILMSACNDFLPNKALGKHSFQPWKLGWTGLFGIWTSCPWWLVLPSIRG